MNYCTRFFYFFLLTLFYNNLFSIEFLGSLKLANGQIITYKLNYTLLSKGKIEGTTITDFNGKDNTTSTIEGTFNAKKNTISFKEVDNLSTKSTLKTKAFCFLNVENAAIKKQMDKTILSGNFVAKYADGRNCIAGKLYMIAADDLNEAFQEITKSNLIKNKDTANMLIEKYNTLLQSSQKTILKTNDVYKVNWISNKIEIEIVDTQKPDNDQVSIFIDDVPVLENYLVTQTIKTLTIPFVNNTCTITIKAIDEGIQPPNTASFTLKDGGKLIPVMSQLKKGETTFIQLNKN